MNVFLKEKFETGEFLCFALNEDGCTHVAMLKDSGTCVLLYLQVKNLKLKGKI